MPQTVYCPKCQAKGSVPDGVPRARIHCPKCQHQFEYRNPSASGSQPQATAPSSQTVKSPARKTSTGFDDLETVQPLAAVSSTGMRRAPLSQASQGDAGKPGNPLLYALVGISGVATLLLAIVMVLLWRGSGKEQAPAPPLQADRPELTASAPLERVADGIVILRDIK